jgi:putative PEP-CTERM system histidine kinase
MSVDYHPGMIGYLICATLFVLLLGLALTVWRERLAGSSLPVAFAAEALWAGTLVGALNGLRIPALAAAGIETLRALAWATVLARCVAGNTRARVAHILLRLCATALSVVAVVVVALLASGHAELADRYLPGSWLWLGLALSILGLMLVEQVARNTRSAQEWRVKYVWLALGGLFSWDLLLNSMALLHGGLEPTLWNARGYVNALLGGLLVIGVRRIEGWRGAAFLSPNLVFFNATLLGAAVYIFGMAAASYFIRNYGGSWGAVGQAVFLAGAAIVLVVAVLSEQFRAWSRVMLAKHFFPYRYDYRQEWRKLTRALSPGEGSVYERVVRVMAASVNCAGGGLWLKGADGSYTRAGGDLGATQVPRETGAAAFFDYLHKNEWICDLEEARGGRARADIPAPPEWMRSQTSLWLIVPLICEDSLVGFVALGQPLAPMRLTWEEIDLLRAAGRQVASYLAFEQAARRLAESRQFEALNRLSAVLMHDLRHLIAQQALVVENAARHRGNPAFFDDAILTIDNSVRRMSTLMDALRRGVVSERARVDLAALVSEAAERCGNRQPLPTLKNETKSLPVLANRERLLHVLEHVIRNSQDATPPEGEVTVSVQETGAEARIEIRDTGCGMDAEFVRERLFKPFDTTKGERGMGIGAYDAREFIRHCGGEVEVDSTPGVGTRFLIRLPLASMTESTAPAAPSAMLEPTHAS